VKVTSKASPNSNAEEIHRISQGAFQALRAVQQNEQAQSTISVKPTAGWLPPATEACCGAGTFKMLGDCNTHVAPSAPMPAISKAGGAINTAVSGARFPA